MILAPVASRALSGRISRPAGGRGAGSSTLSPGTFSRYVMGAARHWKTALLEVGPVRTVNPVASITSFLARARFYLTNHGSRYCRREKENCYGFSARKRVKTGRRKTQTDAAVSAGRETEDEEEQGIFFPLPPPPPQKPGASNEFRITFSNLFISNEKTVALNAPYYVIIASSFN